jgi:adenosine kinase
MLDVLSTGYPSLDYICRVSHSPAVGETGLVRTPPSRYTFGGCGANVAVGLARLDFKSGVSMVVGDDEAGRAYIHHLQREGVDTRDIIYLPGGSTSESRLYVNPEGEHQNFFYPGAADAWHGELQLSSLAEASHALLTVGPAHYNRQFVALANHADIPLVWQLKPDIYAYPPDALADLARSSVLLLINRIECDYLVSTLGLKYPAELLSDKTRLVALTLGSAGSRIYAESGEYHVPAVSPPQVIDSTGAGDAYATGFLAGWLQGRSPLICAQIGAVVASFALETVGCQTNLPDQSAMKQRYGENFGEL